jgi:glucose-1-phosphate adenylyltransferase
MDFRHLLRTHRESQAAVTIAVLPVAEDQVSGFGIVRLDDSGKVTDFIEKPKTAEAREPFRTPAEWIERRGIASAGREFLASMGIYVFERKALLDLLNARPLATDFGKEIFPRSIGTHHVQAHLFDGYWEDLGTVKSYHEANLALADERPPFDFHSQEGVIYTRMRFLPASRVNGAKLEHCLTADGCVIEEGARISHSVIGLRSRIGRDVTIRDSVIIGADRFETDAERDANRRKQIPNFTIGSGTVIERAILDKDCRIGSNVRIVNARNVTEEEGVNYVIREGIVVIPKGIIVPDGTVI